MFSAGLLSTVSDGVVSVVNRGRALSGAAPLSAAGLRRRPAARRPTSPYSFSYRNNRPSSSSWFSPAPRPSPGLFGGLFSSGRGYYRQRRINPWTPFWAYLNWGDARGGRRRAGQDWWSKQYAEAL